MQRRTAEELIASEADSALSIVREMCGKALVSVEILPRRDEDSGRKSLEALQISTRSTFGSVAYYLGGILINGGWVRLLGAGCDRCPRSIDSWNRNKTNLLGDVSLPAMIIIGDDVIGGTFAINGGSLPGIPGDVHYFAPDGLEWEDLGLGYTDFLAWITSARFSTFYADYLWPCCDKEVANNPTDRGFLIQPFPFTAGAPFHQRQRNLVPMEELYSLYQSLRTQLLPQGSQ